VKRWGDLFLFMKGTEAARDLPANSRIDEVDNIVKARDTSIGLQNSPVEIFSCLPVVSFSRYSSFMLLLLPLSAA
jgi:hypothetical protein